MLWNLEKKCADKRFQYIPGENHVSIVIYIRMLPNKYMCIALQAYYQVINIFAVGYLQAMFRKVAIGGGSHRCYG